jgi:hypothetical protein
MRQANGDFVSMERDPFLFMKPLLTLSGNRRRAGGNETLHFVWM